MDLETNYRCPAPVVERAVRLVEHNRERFVKRIVARLGTGGRLVLAPDPTDEVPRITRAIRSWPADGTTRAVLARTNRELLAAAIAALDLDLPFRMRDVTLPIEDPRLDDLLDRLDAIAAGTAGAHLLLLAGRLRREVAAERSVIPPDASGERLSPADLASALLGWSAPLHDVGQLRSAVEDRRRRLAALRRDDAALTLATAHGTKGLEWDHVVVLADGFPGRRSMTEAAEPERLLEEERRLAYVAWTRARRSLTLLYDPAAPSSFLLEAFDADELGVDQADA